MIELRLADTTGIDRETHRELMRGALGTDFVENCARRMTMTQVDCVVAAADPESAAACHERPLR